MTLLACPFCRETFTEGEGTHCTHCDIPLRPFASLPLSYEARLEGGTAALPEQEPLNWLYLGRNRGTLLMLGILGIGLFFGTWATVTLPFDASFSGVDFAKRMGWPWASFVAWLVFFPTVLSRRSPLQMVTARIPIATLASIPAMTACILLLFPPKGGYLPLRVHFSWALWGTLIISLFTVFQAFRFGGTIEWLHTPNNPKNPSP